MGGLLDKLLEIQEEQRQKGLSRREMFENAIHESGHAVAAVCLGIGPLRAGIKLWRHGHNERGTGGISWGATRICQWAKSEAIVRSEIEGSIVSVLAGKLSQYRLTEVFREEGWTAHPASYAASLELTGAWTRDDAMVNDLLAVLPLRTGEALASALVSLEDRTQRLLDKNWPAVQAVAKALLKTKHYSLSGKTITSIVNQATGSTYQPIQSCRCIERPRAS
jgi:hypothetical protein